MKEIILVLIVVGVMVYYGENLLKRLNDLLAFLGIFGATVAKWMREQDEE